VEVRFRRRDGSTFVGQITTTSVRDETGSDVVIDGILTDITARKRREEQLQAAKEEAEAARQAAEAASRSKSLFLAGVAHDLSSPLSGIIGFADVLQQELPAPQAEQAALIERSGRRIEKMAGQLLELARMESCGTCFDLAPHDVRAVAEDVVQAARDEACHAGIDLTLDAPPAPAVALIEEEALRRVLDNLVRNAIKYGEAGDRVRVWVRPAAGDAAPAHGLQAPDGPGVTAGAPVRLDAGTSVVLGVDDTGPGIAPAFLERLFEPFARNAPGTEGTGLGLAVSKELVVRMGGTIRVRSEEGTGTRFRVWLPGTAA
jgi:signal transduction histidine kinase